MFSKPTVAVVAAFAVLVPLTAGTASAASAADSFTVSPRVGAAVGGLQTESIVTGPTGSFDGTSTVSIGSCSTTPPTTTNSDPSPVAGGASPTVSSVSADGTTLTMLVPVFQPSYCTVTVTTGGTATNVGSWQWATGTVAYVSPFAMTPSLVPSAASVQVTLVASVANYAAASGDLTGLTGATAFALTCPSGSFPGTMSTPSALDFAAGVYSQTMTVAVNTSSVPVETACGFQITLASGNVITGASMNPPGVWVSGNAPMMTVTPASGPENQIAPGTEAIMLTGSGLAAASGVDFAFCPPSNATATYPVLGMKPGADGNSISVQVPAGVPQSHCSIIASLPANAATSRPAGYTIASNPPVGGFQFLPPYQGPITVTVTNPYTGATPNTGIADADLWVSVLADPTGGGSVAGNSAFSATNATTLTSALFTGLAGYDSTAHTATITLAPPLISGNLYFSNADLTGAPPNPTNSTVRYGFTEFTYNANGLDVDLTLIDQIGITMSNSLVGPNPQGGTETIPGTYRDTGCLVDIVNDLSNQGVNLNPADASAGPGAMRYNGTDPTVTPADGQWTAADLQQNPNWSGLVGASKDPAPYPGVGAYTNSVTQNLTLTDMLGDKNYNGAFDYTATLANDSNGIPTWTLSGSLVNGTVLGPQITLEQAGLSAAGTQGGSGYGVYGQDGPFNVALPASGATVASPAYQVPVGWSSGGSVPVVWQNTVKTIYRDFIAGFAYGYWNSTYGQGNDTGLNAQNFTLNPLLYAYKIAQPTYPNNGQVAWNVYDDVVRANSNVNGGGNPKPSGAYGMPYSDTFVQSDLSPNQQQGWATGWNITVGDPAGCDVPDATLAPASQTVVGRVGTPLVVSTATVSPTPVGAMEEYVSSGFTGPVTYTLVTPQGTPATLPTGLVFSKSTGVISGTPSGTFPTTPYVVNGTDGTNTAQASIALQVGVRTITPAIQRVNGTVGAPVTPTLPYAATFFAAAPVYAISPALPTGLVISKSTGVISGTPTVAATARQYLVTATGPTGLAEATVNITVNGGAAISPTTQNLTGTAGTAVSPTAAYVATGYDNTVAYTVSPALPEGLTFNSSTGVISGTPTEPTAGTVSFTVTGKGQVNTATAVVNVTIGSSVRGLTPADQNLTWQVGAYSATATMVPSGFAGAVTYALSGAALPAGLSFNRATGIISGTPTRATPQGAAQLNFTVTATGTTSTASAAVALAINPAAPSPSPTPTPSPTPSPTPTPTPSAAPCLPPNQLFPDGTCGQIA